MFVSVVLDPGSEERARELANIIAQYGFEKVQRGVWESALIHPDTLVRLKYDLDRATDAFDRIRIYQYPVEGTLVISYLKDKKWQKLVSRPPAQK
ncbi:CRISPR-associated protein Cas2 [Treponema sp. J25]|uniref:CRISPR-associated protein Cas2 n=1 Tax=Treponema sp. J25 TaxID=2094121 RepID=UPI001053BFF6|nr:CRISPR-associated protein Cas2 [Treponema sp. J25]TCW62236.1 CRISPR-associated protein Cas2 [Treponema sp. J25]